LKFLFISHHAYQFNFEIYVLFIDMRVIIKNGIVRFVVCEHAETILVGFKENRG